MARFLLAFVKFGTTFHFTRIKLPMKHIVYYFTNSNHNHEIQKRQVRFPHLSSYL